MLKSDEGQFKNTTNYKTCCAGLPETGYLKNIKSSQPSLETGEKKLRELKKIPKQKVKVSFY